MRAAGEGELKTLLYTTQYTPEDRRTHTNRASLLYYTQYIINHERTDFYNVRSDGGAKLPRG